MNLNDIFTLKSIIDPFGNENIEIEISQYRHDFGIIRTCLSTSIVRGSGCYQVEMNTKESFLSVVCSLLF